MLIYGLVMKNLGLFEGIVFTVINLVLFDFGVATHKTLNGGHCWKKRNHAINLQFHRVFVFVFLEETK